MSGWVGESVSESVSNHDLLCLYGPALRILKTKLNAKTEKQIRFLSNRTSIKLTV